MRYSRFCGFIVCLLLACSALAQDSAQQLYEKAMNGLIGSGANRSPLTAVEWMRASAEKGYAPAQVAYGSLLDTGTYVASMPSQAADWYRKAAEQGDTLAQWALGRQYLTGNGVSRDVKAAERWLRPAAEKGDPFAQLMLGLSLVERTPESAVPWFRKAAEQGLPQAQYRLGLAYDQGWGANVDKAEAYVWILLSSENGRGGAEPKLAEVESALGTTKVEALKSRVREMQRTMTRSVNAHGCTGWDGELSELPTVPPLNTQRFCR